MTNQVHQMAADLFDRVLKPVVLGGELQPLDPIGELAEPVADAMVAASRGSAHASWVDVARVRRARLLLPVDALPWVGRDEALMAVLLNDMLRGVDPEINSLLSPKRCNQVLDGVLRMMGTEGDKPLVGPPTSLGQALVRHATFAMIGSVQRADTTVSWWCGGAKFMGRRPPARLMLWPRVRRVSSHSDMVGLHDMAREPQLQTKLGECVQGMMLLTPLTDLATAGRSQPAFTWTAPLQALLLTHGGYNLAMRAARVEWNGRSLGALKKAAAELSGSAPIRGALKSFLQDLEGMTTAA